MPSARKAWTRLRDLPEELVENMPLHIRSTFEAARLHQFEVEMLSAGARVPGHRRARRRFVLVADDLARLGEGGPVNFDLEALAEDVRRADALRVGSPLAQNARSPAERLSAPVRLRVGSDRVALERAGQCWRHQMQ